VSYQEPAGQEQPASTGRSTELDEVSTLADDLVALLSEQEGLDEVLDRLAKTALWAIAVAEFVSITMVTGEESTHTAVTTDGAIATLDAQQHTLGDGPCLEAIQQRRTVRASLAEAYRRWPAFARAAEESNVHCYLAAPLLFLSDDMHGQPDVVGALNAYCHADDAFSEDDEALLRLLASGASAAIGTARKYLYARKLAHNLQRALSSRAGIDQAKGVLMAAHSVDADTAFGMLVKHSQHHNAKVVDVAHSLLASLRTR
jgi:GAF domain-containing protein